MIEMVNLERTFKVLNHKKGLKGAITDLFSHDYNYVKAVNGITMTIDDGQIIGYVGPNGAGKSTTIKMLCGVLQPTGGTISVNGRNPYANKKEHMKKLGVVFGQRTQLWWSIPVRESFGILKDIYETDDAAFKKNLSMFEDLVHIQDLYGKPVRQLSLGQRMLCEVAAAFLHDPEVVFLDEPTIGLDIAIKESIRKLIKTLNQEKKTTILLTSHDTKDIESLCERVAIIDKGSLIFDGEIDKLKSMFGRYRTIRLTMQQNARSFEEIEKLFVARFGVDGIQVTKDEHSIFVIVNEQKVSFVNAMDFVMKNLKFENISIEETGVEEIIKKIYAGGITDEKVSGIN